MKTFAFPSLFILIFLSASCEIIHPSEEIPAYIHIPKIDLIVPSADAATQGSASQKITDAWVFIDDQPLGAFELPVTVPVLKSGSHQLKIKSGIKLNGFTKQRVQYQFYNSYDMSYNFNVNTVDTIKPQVQYYPNIHFAWKENFENSVLSIQKIGSSDTSIVLVTEKSILLKDNGGNGCGAIYLDAQHPTYKGIGALSSTAFNLPGSGTTVYLEMDYQCNNSFEVGIFAINGGIELPVLILYPSASWNKVYVSLGPKISENPSSQGYFFYLHAINENSLSKYIYIDNLKIIYP